MHSFNVRTCCSSVFHAYIGFGTKRLDMQNKNIFLKYLYTIYSHTVFVVVVVVHLIYTTGLYMLVHTWASTAHAFFLTIQDSQWGI